MIAELHQRLLRITMNRPPDFIVGGQDNPYLLRWHVIPRNRWLNIYLHRFVRDDDDRALHDHPWPSLSMVLLGSYVEHTIKAGGVHRRKRYDTGSIMIRSPWFAHRIELCDGPCWTLFVTGPRVREWGFHHPSQGWIPWHEFTDPNDRGTTRADLNPVNGIGGDANGKAREVV